jgi:hypothetical protein
MQQTLNIHKDFDAKEQRDQFSSIYFMGNVSFLTRFGVVQQVSLQVFHPAPLQRRNGENISKKNNISILVM